MKKNHTAYAIFYLISLVFVPSTVSQTIAITGGIVIDVSNFGRSQNDIHDAVILIEGELITEVGSRSSTKIPTDAQIIDVDGMFILPGLIDGYGALDNQAFANAYLYMGVTSIVGCHGYRRNPLYTEANPCPTIYLYGDVGHFEITTEEMLNQIEAHAKNGVKFLNLMYALTPEQLKLAIERAHELSMPTIGEFAELSYGEALETGIDAILHFGRYAIELAPPDMRQRIIQQPHGPAFREFRVWLSHVDPEDDVVQEFASILGSHSAALMPTLAISCVDAPFFDNVWQEPVGTILKPEDIQNPLDKETGKHNFNSQQMTLVTQFVDNILNIECQFYKAGAKYLAGSGNDINGTLPGISLHQELELLTRVGLSHREAMAAATSNFGEILRWKGVGQIKPGYRADILVVEKNPLKDIKNLKDIEMVFLKGQRIDRKKLLQIEPDKSTVSSQDKSKTVNLQNFLKENRKTDEEITGLGRPKVHEVSENVLAITDLYHSAGADFGTNAGILFTSKSVVFIDAGMSIASADFLWKVAEKRMKGDEDLYLILTHHHADHVFGMCLMKEKGAKVIGHTTLQDWFQRLDGERYKQFLAQRFGWSTEEGDRVFGDVILTAPDEVIDKDSVLIIDGEEIHVLFTPGHVADELSVYHPKSRTLFAGDVIYEGTDLTTRFGGPEEWKTWISQLERLKTLEIDTIVPGHGKLCSVNEIERNIAFLKGLF